MDLKKLNKLTPGAKVRWREGKLSPRAGELTDHGEVVVHDGRRFILWQDGQETDSLDDWALLNVEVA